MNRVYIILLSIVSVFAVSVTAQAQNGGTSTYTFLEIPVSARLAGLGGKNVSIFDDNNSLGWYNPALIKSDFNRGVNVNYLNYIAGINAGLVSYTHHEKGIGNFMGSIQYINYGKFIEANEFGNITGDFSANEFALIAGYTRSIADSTIRVGVNVKTIYSQLEQYNSLGIAADLSLLYQSRDKLFCASVLFRNIGTQIKTYKSTKESLPFDIVAGASAKLAHAPLRFSVTFHSLNNYNLATDEYTTNDVTGLKEIKQKSGFNKFGDEFLRHLIIAGEFIPTKSLYISIGYNFKRRKELMVEDKKSITGFTLGAGLRLKRFSIDYALSKYHLAGTSNHFTLSFRI
jgi:hypothetical protein